MVHIQSQLLRNGQKCTLYQQRDYTALHVCAQFYTVPRMYSQSDENCGCTYRKQCTFRICNQSVYLRKVGNYAYTDIRVLRKFMSRYVKFLYTVKIHLRPVKSTYLCVVNGLLLLQVAPVFFPQSSNPSCSIAYTKRQNMSANQLLSLRMQRVVNF